MNEEMRIRSAEVDESRSYFERVFDSIGASIVALDAHLAVLSWSRGATQMWGLRPDEVVGRPFFSIDFGLPTSPLREPVDTCMSTGKPSVHVELDGVNRLGQGTRCTVTVNPLGDRGEGVVLLIEESGRHSSTPRRRTGLEGQDNC